MGAGQRVRFCAKPAFMMWNTILSLFFLLPLCIFFFLFENASSNPIIQWGWNGKTQMRNPLHRYRKTSLKQNREKGRETDNTLKGYSYSSMYQNSSPLLIIVLFASFQGSVHVFVFLYSVGYLTYSVYAYFLYAWISADHLPKYVVWILCGIMSTFFIDTFSWCCWWSPIDHSNNCLVLQNYSKTSFFCVKHKKEIYTC